jgi:hypothetical protein
VSVPRARRTRGRRIGGYRGEIDAGSRKPAQGAQEKLDQSRAIAFHEAYGLLDVQAVDDDRGSGGGRVTLPRFEDAAVVVDGGLRAEPADEADAGHGRPASLGREFYRVIALSGCFRHRPDSQKGLAAEQVTSHDSRPGPSVPT